MAFKSDVCLHALKKAFHRVTCKYVFVENIFSAPVEDASMDIREIFGSLVKAMTKRKMAYRIA